MSRVDTEFVLVLDDDFVRSPLSCLECALEGLPEACQKPRGMVWHMRSHLHSLTLPFDAWHCRGANPTVPGEDLLGFPILEDERNFGAFRGSLRPPPGSCSADFNGKLGTGEQQVDE